MNEENEINYQISTSISDREAYAWAIMQLLLQKSEGVDLYTNLISVPEKAVKLADRFLYELEQTAGDLK